MTSTNWKHGYYADAGYTYGHYPETLPARLRWAALLRNHWLPESHFRYLDCGCGQGYSLILAAIQHPESEFVGIDFLPEHIAHARRLAKLVGLTNVRFIEGDFIALSRDPSALGDFDFIVAHGITTWIAPAVREGLFSLVGHVLKPGGVFYNSYNTYPGWLSTSPFQRLVLLQQRNMSGHQALKRSQELLTQLKSAAPGLFTALPQLEKRLESLQGKDPAYLVQEYNNQHWQPVFVSQMMEALRPHKLEYLGTATLADAFEGVFGQNLNALLAGASDADTREQLKDYALNQSFRRDLFIKGNNRTWRQETLDELKATTLRVNPLIKRPAAGESFIVQGGAIEIKGNPETFARALEALGDVSKPTTVAQASDRLPEAERGAGLLQIVSYLLHGNWVLQQVPGDHTPAVRKFNNVIIQQALLGAPYRYLAVPGGGTQLMRDMDLVFLHLDNEGCNDSQMVSRARGIMRQMGLSVADNGKPATDDAEFERLLAPHVEGHISKRPLFQRMGLVSQRR